MSDDDHSTPAPTEETRAQKIRKAIRRVVKDLDADVFLFNAGIDVGTDSKVLSAVSERPAWRPNVLLVLLTFGGNPEAAYRIARTFQRNYSKVTLLVPAECKSAGTLVAIGAHELVVTDNGQLGPLDIQIAEKDELYGMASGLLTTVALSELGKESQEMFKSSLSAISSMGRGRISFRVAADIASNLTVGLFGKVYEHIQPMQVGATGRANNIMAEYGARLDAESNNLVSEEALATLVSGFPSHGFVIDREEADEYFKEIREPSELEVAMLDAIGVLAQQASYSGSSVRPYIGYICPPPKPPPPAPDPASASAQPKPENADNASKDDDNAEDSEQVSGGQQAGPSTQQQPGAAQGGNSGGTETLDEPAAGALGGDGSTPPPTP